jgi:hypothetical protein
MNNAGLESGIYEQLRSYSEVLNHHLVMLKTEPPSPNFHPPAEVAELIRALGEKVPFEVSIQFLAGGPRDSGSVPDAVVRRLRSALESGLYGEETLGDLERLAEVLGRQQAGAFARMRRMR